jgi:hypothetical protein
MCKLLSPSYGLQFQQQRLHKTFSVFISILRTWQFFKDFYTRSKIPCSLQVTFLLPTTLFYIPVTD